MATTTKPSNLQNVERCYLPYRRAYLGTSLQIQVSGGSGNGNTISRISAFYFFFRSKFLEKFRQQNAASPNMADRTLRSNSLSSISFETPL